MNATNEVAEINATIEDLKNENESLKISLEREKKECIDWFKRYQEATEDANLFKELLKQIINKN
jgi:archaellum component FlaC